MSFNWINVEDYTSDIFLLMDRCLVRNVVHHCEDQQDCDENWGIVQAYNPTVVWYFGKRAPETTEKMNRLVANAAKVSSILYENPFPISRTKAMKQWHLRFDRYFGARECRGNDFMMSRGP